MFAHTWQLPLAFFIRIKPWANLTRMRIGLLSSASGVGKVWSLEVRMWGGHFGNDSSPCPCWYFFCFVFHMAFSWLYKSSGLGFVFQGIQINPTTLDIQCRKRWTNMHLGSLAFTISVFWKMRVLLNHHVQFCKRLHQEALESRRCRDGDGDGRCRLLKNRRYPPLKLPHFWSWHCWPKIQRWSFGCEISVTRKRPVQTKMQLATDDVSLCFLIILQCKAQNVSLKGMPSPAIPILQAAGRTCSSTEPLGAPSDCRRDTKKTKPTSLGIVIWMQSCMYTVPDYVQYQISTYLNMSNGPRQVVHKQVSHSQFSHFGSRKGRNDSNLFDPSGNISLIARDNA